MDSADFDAYKTLTSIQGYDSFKLSRNSSLEMIGRAYQAQILIWHPDRNPDDPTAVQVYTRMQRAYSILMDLKQRQSHDERLAVLEPSLVARTSPHPVSSAHAGASSSDISAGVAEAAARQLAPEDLGDPPRSAKPFAYVDKQPNSLTPAAMGGMRRGDAILRIGDSTHLRDLQSVLQASLLTPVPAS